MEVGCHLLGRDAAAVDRDLLRLEVVRQLLGRAAAAVDRHLLH